MLIGVPEQIRLVNARLNNVRFSFVTDVLLRAGPPLGCPPPARSVSTALEALLVAGPRWQCTCLGGTGAILQTAAQKHFIFVL